MFARLLAVLALGLLFVTACNRKNNPPPPESTNAAAVESASPWRVQLKISPDHPSMAKPITFVVHISDQHGQPVNNAQVSGALTMKLMDMDVTQLNFAPKGNGDYEASRPDMDMSGAWNLAVEAAYGSTQVKKTFEVTVND